MACRLYWRTWGIGLKRLDHKESIMEEECLRNLVSSLPKGDKANRLEPNVVNRES